MDARSPEGPDQSSKEGPEECPDKAPDKGSDKPLRNGEAFVSSASPCPQVRAMVLRALFFEQWLRFRFLCEQTGPQGPGDNKALSGGSQEGLLDLPLVLRVPETERSELLSVYPELLPLLDRLDGREPDAAVALAAVVAYTQACLGRAAVLSVLNAPEFMADVSRFQHRLEIEADELNPQMAFGPWLERFEVPDHAQSAPGTITAQCRTLAVE